MPIDIPVKARKHSGAALILIDWVNDFNFPGGENLRRSATAAARNALKLKQRITAAGVPTIYTNDNFGQWQSDFPSVLRYVKEETPGAELAELLKPSPQDFFILKPKHSAFYLTPLELLLKNLNVHHLILCGLQTDICVLLTAHDAHMRDFMLTVPSDCSASEKALNHRNALEHMKHCLSAHVLQAEHVNAAYVRKTKRAGN